MRPAREASLSICYPQGRVASPLAKQPGTVHERNHQSPLTPACLKLQQRGGLEARMTAAWHHMEDCDAWTGHGTSG